MDNALLCSAVINFVCNAFLHRAVCLQIASWRIYLHPMLGGRGRACFGSTEDISLRIRDGSLVSEWENSSAKYRDIACDTCFFLGDNSILTPDALRLAEAGGMRGLSSLYPRKDAKLEANTQLFTKGSNSQLF